MHDLTMLQLFATTRVVLDNSSSYKKSNAMVNIKAVTRTNHRRN